MSSIKDLLDSLAAESLRPIESIVTIEGKEYRFHFRRLTAEQADEYGAAMLNASGAFDPAKSIGARARLVSLTLCDDTGKKVAGVAHIAGWPTSLVKALYDEAARINGMGAIAEAEAGNE